MIDIVLRDVTGEYYISDPCYLEEFDWGHAQLKPRRIL